MQEDKDSLLNLSRIGAFGKLAHRTKKINDCFFISLLMLWCSQCMCCAACHVACATSCSDSTASTCDACSEGWQPDGFGLFSQACKGTVLHCNLAELLDVNCVLILINVLGDCSSKIMPIAQPSVCKIVLLPLSHIKKQNRYVPQCGALRFTDGEISWVSVCLSVGGWLFFLQTISQDWERLRTSNLAHRWRLMRGWCAHLDYWEKFFNCCKFGKTSQKVGQKPANRKIYLFCLHGGTKRLETHLSI